MSPIDWPCPRCNVREGQPCRTAQGRVYTQLMANGQDQECVHMERTLLTAGLGRKQDVAYRGKRRKI